MDGSVITRDTLLLNITGRRLWNLGLLRQQGFQLSRSALYLQFIAPAAKGSTERTRPSEEWIWKHVQQSQYLLQIVKCKNISCCSPPRTNLFDLLVDRFLPAPLLFRRGYRALKSRVKVHKPSNQTPDVEEEIEFVCEVDEVQTPI
ncbi:unnamed protein product [Allacma fusca]|uniref:Uncharacterized protein n=1 Tax=Allacma fusca TaxID=39272 RepID=A0A8J2J0M9_9HEXA|nr:unnamed protein product [Allacma fusca]